MSTAVHVSGLKKKFKIQGGYVEALCGVDFEVEKGEVYGFLGPNGAGKTTALRILTTLLSFDEGSVQVAGYDVKQEPDEVRKHIGYVSQKGGADRHSTGWENLMLQGQLYGFPEEVVRQRAKELVQQFQIEECVDRLVSTYSGGQRRRLDIALGMVHKPDLLFLDEPTTGLDPQNRANLWELIQQMKGEGITVFLTSHYLDEIDFLADRLAIMDHGKIVTIGTPRDLKKQISGDIVTVGIKSESHSEALTLFQTKESFIREVNYEGEELRIYVDRGEAALPQILRILDQAQIPLSTIKMSLPTLDDVFLKQTGRFLREESHR